MEDDQRDFGKQTQHSLQEEHRHTGWFFSMNSVDGFVKNELTAVLIRKVAGMLIYYILSGGHHPFGDDIYCETNILDDKYNLEHVEDVVAKDLIERMICKDPERRPTVGECLIHPFFWNAQR